LFPRLREAALLFQPPGLPASDYLQSLINCLPAIALKVSIDQTKKNPTMSESDNEVPLLERAEFVDAQIPKDAQGPLAELERDIINAEVQLSEFMLVR
jgi:hypothetical protein